MGAVRDRHTAEYLGGLIDALDAVIWEFDWSTGAFTFVSESCERLLGFSREEWLRPGFWVERLHPEDAEWATSYCVTATQDGLDHDFEYRMVRADGTTIWVRDIVSVDAERRMAGCLKGLLIDISDRVATSAAVQQAEKRYREMITGARLIAAEIDATGTITFVNDSACELLGHAADELLGRSFLELLKDELRATVSEDLAARMRDERDAATVPLTFIAKDSTERVALFHVSTLRSVEGEPIGAVALGEDVTDRAALERKLARKAEEFESIFQLSGDLFFRMNPDGVYSDYSAPRNELLYAPPEMFIGKHYSEVLPPKIAEVTRGALEEIARTGDMVIVEYPMSVPADAESVWEARLLPLSGGDTAVISRDVTKRVAREQALAQSELRYRRVVEDSPFGIHFWELEEPDRLILLGANDAAATTTGIDYTELVWREMRDVFPNVDPEVRAVYCEVARGGGVRQFGTVRHAVPLGERLYELTVFQTQPGRAAGMFVDVTARHEAARKEAAYQDRLRAMAVQLGRTEDKERRRLAEELHDRVSQSLAVARMHLDAAAGSSPEDVPALVDRARFLLEQAIAETRTITTELAPPVLYELGLGSGLRWVAEKMEETYELSVELDIDFNESLLDEEAKMVLFRACRELLMNVVKHSGQLHAKTALHEHDGRVVLTVSDAGAGFPASERDDGAPDGFGLFSIRERVPQLGGTFSIASAAGQGTRVIVTLPVRGAGN